jgi:soluble cytochrome b562
VTARGAAGLLALLACLLTGLAACGEAPEDKARDDGKQLGEAMRTLYDAETPQEAADALPAVRTAVQDLRGDARDEVGDQVDAQEDSVQDAQEALQGLRNANDQAQVEDAIGDLRTAINDIRSQANDNRDNSVANEFWRGFRDGFDD